ncbi:hypothetical protein INT44_006769 [Umbelopsis vinacea]|uniref:Uncharacterized protein n=1 Tax=Umbelopsis vinacea TaxID=44442 RepID=A0A8H7PIE8_9FUNG|nr:hypothetical protein INT44_006769 [Umbelopsis vinacea]
MQRFTIFLAIAAAILSCGPRFSVAAPSPTYSVGYVAQDEYKHLPVVLNECQDFPEEAFDVMNTTPYFISLFASPACQDVLDTLPPRDRYDGRPILSVKMQEHY